MEQSIEKIWKEGFINNDALVAPKLNNLYDRKSVHIIDKYKRMFKLNINLIAAGAFILLIISFLVRMPYMGVPMFFLLCTMAMVDKKLLEQLHRIDKNRSSYEYLKSFLNWWEQKNKINIRMARVLYPYVFLSILLGLWFMEIDGKGLGAIIVERIVEIYPEVYLVFGVPLIGIIGVLIIASVLLYFSKRLYTSDINLAYGQVINKIKELTTDMEELRS